MANNRHVYVITFVYDINDLYVEENTIAVFDDIVKVRSFLKKRNVVEHEHQFTSDIDSINNRNIATKEIYDINIYNLDTGNFVDGATKDFTLNQ